ncbi:MAG: hypothetical protein A2W37_06825 [Chloroflexi bacterium RBG_16_63_12]|nr:MAG: hypothetical protein A2W37_06825 [Chloroflexi bacterium RBG_16_63_12]
MGKFYDAQGNLIADENNTTDYWPVAVIPIGGRIPFELFAPGIQAAARFELATEAQPTTQTTRQDFEFSALSQSDEEDSYCVAGTLRNPGNAVWTHLTVVVILWDSQNSMINWGNYDVRFPGDVVGDRTTDFKICVSPPNQGVARYELRAWGN